MAMPNYTKNPKKPTSASPSIPTHKCGENWDKYTIRSPYKSTDLFSELMPRVPVDRFGRYFQYGSDEFKEGANAYDDFIKGNVMRSSIAHAESAMSRYTIDEANKKLLKKYVERAKKYESEANAVGKALYPNGMTSDRKPTFDGYPPVSGAEMCLALRDLAIASVTNARCAAEAAIFVGIHNKNKAKGGLSIQYAPKKSSAPPIISAPEPAPEEPEKKPTPKKKDNTILIVAAAAVALLMAKK